MLQNERNSKIERFSIATKLTTKWCHEYVKFIRFIIIFSNLQIIFLFSCLECLEWDYDKALEEYNNQKVGFYLLFLAKLNYCFIFLA